MKKLLLFSLLLVPGTVNAQTLELPKYYTASEWAVMFGHAIDTATTQRCLGAGICHETNPYLMRFNNPIAFTTAKVGIGYVQLYLNRKLARYENPKLAATINILVTGILTGVAIHNDRIVRQYNHAK